MKLIPRLQNELVTVIFQPHQLTITHVKQSNKSAPFIMHAYQQIPLNNLELEKLIIYNPTKIQSYIANFLSVHKISNAFVLFALSGPGIFERYVPLNNAHAQPTDFDMPELKKLQWEYEYMYPADNSKSMYYVCGITPRRLFQYQLLAIATKLNVIKITTKRMALHHVYKYLYGSAFRRSQFAIDMLQHNNMIEYMFSQETVHRILQIPTNINIDKVHEITNILSICGLITSERTL